jgi:SPP1 family predicted phage head-tail adaptor
MDAGSLNWRLAILRATTTTGAFNEDIPTWNTLTTVWANKRDVSDGEKERLGQIMASRTTRFQVRYSSAVAGVNAKDRLRCEGVVYDILGVKQIGARHEALEITATARGDA